MGLVLEPVNLIWLAMRTVANNTRATNTAKALHTHTREVNTKLIRPLKPGEVVFIGVLMEAPALVFWFNRQKSGVKTPFIPGIDYFESQ